MEKSVRSLSCSHTSPICGFPTFVQSCKRRLVFQRAVYLSKRRKAFTLDRSYDTNTTNLNAVCQYLQRCPIIRHWQSCLHTSMERNGADNSLHTVILTWLWEYLGIIFCCVPLAAEVRLNAAATKVGLLPAQRLLGPLLKCSICFAYSKTQQSGLLWYSTFKSIKIAKTFAIRCFWLWCRHQRHFCRPERAGSHSWLDPVCERRYANHS